jgi:hypothetical protein
MKGKDRLLRIYTGSELSVITLKNKLKVIGITALIRNDSNNSFLQAAPGVVDLYIQQSDFKKAESIISEFIKTSN